MNCVKMKVKFSEINCGHFGLTTISWNGEQSVYKFGKEKLSIALRCQVGQ